MLSRVLGLNFVRPFTTSASQVIPSVEKFTDKFTLQALDLYKKSKVDVDKELDKVCKHFTHFHH